MLIIRLSRTGKTAQPSYRLIVSEKSKDPWGKHLEILGHYYPKKEAKLVDLKEERLKYWMGKGAQLSETVNNLLINQGLITTAKIRIVKISKRRAAKVAEKNKKDEAAAAAATPKDGSSNRRAEGVGVDPVVEFRNVGQNCSGEKVGLIWLLFKIKNFFAVAKSEISLRG